MLGLGLGLKDKFFGRGLKANDLALPPQGLDHHVGLALPGLGLHRTALTSLDFAVTPRPSKSNQFTCTVNYIINQSLVELREINRKHNVCGQRHKKWKQLSEEHRFLSLFLSQYLLLLQNASTFRISCNLHTHLTNTNRSTVN